MIETHLNRNRQTVQLGLIQVMRELFPNEALKIAYSIQNGIFCCLRDSILSVREVAAISDRLQEWVRKDIPIKLLSFSGGFYHHLLDGIVVKTIYPAHDRSSLTEPFRLIPFSGGFLVYFCPPGNESSAAPPMPGTLSATYEQTQHWLKNIGIETVSDVNRLLSSGKETDLISISEALHEKEISDIADLISHRRRFVRVVLISGPSSSGKTTFTQRLSTQLRVNGLRPVPISLDNYFVNREHTPLDENGKPDYECLEAIDLEFLQRQVAQMIGGEPVETPLFDFVTGKRSEETLPVHLGPSDVLLLEGIHALNPLLLPDVNRNELFKIYLGALFQLNIDLINRVPTTEVRLIRRIVRGELFRGTPPEKTIELWANVRKGETKNIFVFAEEADAMFNSSLLYEMNALRPYAEASLRKIGDDSPHRETRDRLLNLLSFFDTTDSSKIPLNSILREFIGGSLYST